MGKVLIWGKSAYFWKWRISHLRYGLYRLDSSIRIGIFLNNFRKNFFCLKNVSSISTVDFFCKIGEKLSLFSK